jgi:hypothetical protein
MKKFILILAVLNQLISILAQAQDEKVLIIVNSMVYAGLEPEILRYVDDISHEYKVGLFETSGGSAKDLKDFIITRADSLAGCILIGSMPIYWFEIEQDEASNNGYSTFPCDLYFMDLDGKWSDEDQDGEDDTHTGNVAPEIFLARIDASFFSNNEENETEILRKYFNRDHNYWSGSYDLRKTGLAYTDYDWKDYSPINEEMQYLYGTDHFQLIKDNRIGDKDYLENRLSNDQYEFIQIAAHSTADYHGFFLKGSIYRDKIRKSPLKALGYNLFACSACDYSKPCLGNAYIFSESEKSLAVIGTTKIGSMLQFYAFYQPLGQNKSIGQAYLEWFDWIAPFSNYKRSWHYGMTLLGDPLIRFTSGTPNHGPLADIGSSDNIQWPGNTKEVSANVRDDGLPLESSLTFGWEQVSGPGTVTFDSAHSIATSTHFSDLGDYRIKFTASDGQYSSEDVKNIKVSRIKWMGETTRPEYGMSSGLVVRDSLAYLTSHDKLVIANIKNKTNPNWIASWKYPGPLNMPDRYALAVDSGYAYIASCQKGLFIIDISNPFDLNLVGSFRSEYSNEYINDVKILKNVAYLAVSNRGLMILDIHDRSNPILLGICPTDGSAEAVSVQDNYAYIADGRNGLRIIDVTNKKNPREMGFYNISSVEYWDSEYKQNIQVVGDYAYISYQHPDKWLCISIIDVSDKKNPTEVSRLDSHYVNFYVEGNYLYYMGTCDYDVFGIYDITDKVNPKVVETFKNEDIYFQGNLSIYESDQFLYLGGQYMGRGLNIFNLHLDNTAPYVYSGEDRITCNNSYSLTGTEFDDNLPVKSSLSFSWEKLSGQGNTSFDHPKEINTQVSFSDSGTYVLRLTVSDGDLTAYDDVRIACLNKPPECDNVELCEGSNVSDLTAYGDSILWYGDARLTELLGAGVHFSTGKKKPGSYRYYVTQVISGCESRPDSSVLQINPLPEISLGKDTSIFQDENIILIPQAANCTYLWNDGCEDPALEVRGIDMDPGIHDISVLVTDSNTCENSDTIRIQVLQVTGTTATETNPVVQFYPNPTTGILYAKFQNNRNEDILLMLLDQKGSLIKIEKSFVGAGGNILPFDISYLVPGIYTLKIITSRAQFIDKILLE